MNIQMHSCGCDKRQKTFLNSLLSKTICHCRACQVQIVYIHSVKDIGQLLEQIQNGENCYPLCKERKQFGQQFNQGFKKIVFSYVENINKEVGKDQIQPAVSPAGQFQYGVLFKIVDSTKLLTKKEKQMMFSYMHKNYVKKINFFRLLTSIPDQLKKDMVFLFLLIWEQFFILNQSLKLQVQSETEFHRVEKGVQEKMLEKRDELFKNLDGFCGKGKTNMSEVKANHFSNFLREVTSFALRFIANHY